MSSSEDPMHHECHGLLNLAFLFASLALAGSFALPSFLSVLSATLYCCDTSLQASVHHPVSDVKQYSAGLRHLTAHPCFFLAENTANYKNAATF
jgi:hypothetical protein